MSNSAHFPLETEQLRSHYFGLIIIVESFMMDLRGSDTFRQQGPRLHQQTCNIIRSTSLSQAP